MSTDRIMMLLALIAEQSGESVTPVRLEFIAKRLLPFGVDKVCMALERLAESARKFPTVAEIKHEMGVAEPTKRDSALMLADRIIGLIPKYGELPGGLHTTARSLELELGEAAFGLVQRQGGWNLIVARAGENLAALRAQLRDLAESYLKCGVIAEPDFEALPSREEAYTQARLEAPPSGLTLEERTSLEEELARLKSMKKRLELGP